jgi:hypothetical protein
VLFIEFEPVFQPMTETAADISSRPILASVISMARVREYRPYKPGVAGSYPVPPTRVLPEKGGFLFDFPFNSNTVFSAFFN